MSSSNTGQSDQNRRQDDRQRLHSWKAIAGYLSRSVRTVRRWEARENLPVHRHKHTKGSSVYAYRAELDEWRSTTEDGRASGTVHGPATSYSVAASAYGGYAAVAVTAAIIGFLVGTLWPDSGRDTIDLAPTASSDEPDHVLVAETLLDLCLDGPMPEKCIDPAVYLAKLQSDEYDTTRITETLMSPIYSAWGGGNVSAAVSGSDQLKQDSESFSAEVQESLSIRLAEFALALGRVREARGLSSRIRSPLGQFEHDARVLFASGEKQVLTEHLANSGPQAGSEMLLLMSVSGLAKKAARISEAAPVKAVSPAQSDILDAFVEKDGGQLAAAKSLLQVAVGQLAPSDQAYFMVGPDLLASLLNIDGDLQAAIAVLENTTMRRTDAAYNRASLYWLMCQKHLAGLYREAGRLQDARRLETELREALVLADADFPLLLALGDS